MGQDHTYTRIRQKQCLCLRHYFLKVYPVFRVRFPTQRPGNIPGRFGPVRVTRRCRIEAVIIGLGVIRPVALGNPALNLSAGSGVQTSRSTGKSNFHISIGAGLGSTHRDKGTGNIAASDWCIITIEGLRLGAVFRIIVPHLDIRQSNGAGAGIDQLEVQIKLIGGSGGILIIELHLNTASTWRRCCRRRRHRWRRAVRTGVAVTLESRSESGSRSVSVSRCEPV